MNRTTTERLIALWVVELPRRLKRWTPLAADASADSLWTARWPTAAALAPLVAAAIGLLSPFVMPGLQNVYTESLLFLLIAVAIAPLSGSAALGLLVGYVVGDLLHFWLVPTLFASNFTGRLIAYFLLALLLLVLPLLARRVSFGLPFPPVSREARVAITAIVLAVAQGLLVFIWCEATSVLIRPVFGWGMATPITTEAITHVQNQWPLLAIVGAVAAATRVYLEDRFPTGTEVDQLRAAQTMGPAERGFMQDLPLPAQVAISALGTTLLLAGFYSSWIDALIVAIVTAGLGVLRRGLITLIPVRWWTLVQRIPALARIVLGALAGYLLARAVVAPAYNAGVSYNLRPVLFGALLTMAVFYALFPRSSSRSSSANGARRS